jgi:hypothetical protein
LNRKEESTLVATAKMVDKSEVINDNDKDEKMVKN